MKQKSGIVSKVIIDSNPDTKLLGGPALPVETVTPSDDIKIGGGRPIKGYPVDATYVADNGLKAGPSLRLYVVGVALEGSIEGPAIPMFGLDTGDPYVDADYIINQDDYVLPTP